MRRITKHIRNKQPFISLANRLKKLKFKENNSEKTTLERIGSAIELRLHKQKTIAFNRTGYATTPSAEGFVGHMPIAKHKRSRHINLPPHLIKEGATANIHNSRRLEGNGISLSVPLSIKTQNIDIDFQIVHVPDFIPSKGQSP